MNPSQDLCNRADLNNEILSSTGHEYFSQNVMATGFGISQANLREIQSYLDRNYRIEKMTGGIANKGGAILENKKCSEILWDHSRRINKILR